MSKLISSAVVLVALGILTILNADNTSTINLFGARLENVSVIVVAAAGFILGVVYSFVIHGSNLINARRKAGHMQKSQSLKEREAELKEREELVSSAAKQDHTGKAPPEVVPMKDSEAESKGVRSPSWPRGMPKLRQRG